MNSLTNAALQFIAKFANRTNYLSTNDGIPDGLFNRNLTENDAQKPKNSSKLRHENETLEMTVLDFYATIGAKFILKKNEFSSVFEFGWNTSTLMVHDFVNQNCNI